LSRPYIIAYVLAVKLLGSSCNEGDVMDVAEFVYPYFFSFSFSLASVRGDLDARHRNTGERRAVRELVRAGWNGKEEGDKPKILFFADGLVCGLRLDF
jgi:hypothetical protein